MLVFAPESVTVERRAESTDWRPVPNDLGAKVQTLRFVVEVGTPAPSHPSVVTARRGISNTWDCISPLTVASRLLLSH